MNGRPKVLVLQGIPGSGKTTFAKRLISDQPHWYRINGDESRRMMNGDLPFSGKREGVVNTAQKAMVRALLEKGVNVVVDNTNLSERHLDRWRTIADEFNAKFAVHVMETSLDVCLERNLARDNDTYVPANVVINMAR